MQQFIIDNEFRHICDTDDIVKMYISNELDQESLVFRVDVSGFDDNQYEELRKVLATLYDFENSHMLTIISADVEETDDGSRYFYIYCEMPYTKTAGKYHSENDALETELKANVADIVEMYEIVKLLNYEVELDLNSISIVPKKTDLPYPQLCLTPYGFIMGCIRKLEEEPAFVHSPFADIFTFFNDKIQKASLSDGFFGKIGKKLGKGRRPFDDIIACLKNNEDATRVIEENEYIRQIHQELQIPSFELDDVIFEKKLGSGTYGVVCKVVDGNGKVFALKQCVEEEISSLYRESFVLHSLRHPCIVGFNGYCTSSNNILTEWIDGTEHGFMLMEFCECGDLEHFMKKLAMTEYLPIDTLTLLVGQICAACLYIHTKRMVHRDLKLANILVKQTTPFPWIKLCDFGFARANDKVMMTTAGTPLTADPRILKGEGYTDRAELFSLGCIIYYLIYKRYPCQGCYDFESIVRMIENKEVSFGLPKQDPAYQPFIDLVKFLLEINTPKKGQRQSNRESHWREFMRNSCVKNSLKKVDETFQKYFSKK